jgi:predicted aspartyl protease
MGRVYRIVDVSGNGRKQSAIALVDTGADETVIKEELASRLKLKPYGRFLAKCASNTVLEGKYVDVRIKELKTGKETELKVGVSSVPFRTDDIDEEGLDVILGVDFMQKLGLENPI